MSLIVSETENKKFDPISEGLHLAICTGIVDIGMVYNEQYKKMQDKVVLQWEVVDETVNIDGEELHRTISQEYSKSFNEKSNLRKALKSWRGREFTAEELKRFDLRNVLGVPCQLQISHSANGDKVYANIDSIVSYPKGMEKPKPDNEPFAFDLDAETWEEDMLKLPEWLQNKIKASETYQERMNEKPFDDEGVMKAESDEEVPF